MSTPQTDTKSEDEPVDSPRINAVDIFKDFNPEDYEPGFSYAFLKELSRLVAEREAK